MKRISRIVFVSVFFTFSSLVPMTREQEKTKHTRPMTLEQSDIKHAELTAEKQDGAVPDSTAVKKEHEGWHIPGVPGGTLGSAGVMGGGVVLLALATYGVKRGTDWVATAIEKKGLASYAKQLKENAFAQYAANDTAIPQWYRDFIDFVCDQVQTRLGFKELWKKYGTVAQKEPHLLLAEDAWSEVLDDEQMTKLLHILEEYVAYYYYTTLRSIIPEEQYKDLWDLAIEYPRALLIALRSDHYADRINLIQKEDAIKLFGRIIGWKTMQEVIPELSTMRQERLASYAKQLKENAFVQAEEDSTDIPQWYRDFIDFVAEGVQTGPHFKALWELCGDKAQKDPHYLLTRNEWVKRLDDKQMTKLLHILEEYVAYHYYITLRSIIPEEQYEDLWDLGIEYPRALLCALIAGGCYAHRLSKDQQNGANQLLGLITDWRALQDELRNDNTIKA